MEGWFIPRDVVFIIASHSARWMLRWALTCKTLYAYTRTKRFWEHAIRDELTMWRSRLPADDRRFSYIDVFLEPPLHLQHREQLPVLTLQQRVGWMFLNNRVHANNTMIIRFGPYVGVPRPPERINRWIIYDSVTGDGISWVWKYDDPNFFIIEYGRWRLGKGMLPHRTIPVVADYSICPLIESPSSSAQFWTITDELRKTIWQGPVEMLNGVLIPADPFHRTHYGIGGWMEYESK